MKQPLLPRWFLILGIVFGTGYALLLAPLQVPDEWAHFIRAYGVSEGAWVARVLTPMPISTARLYAEFPESLEHRPAPVRWITAERLRKLMAVPLADEKREPWAAVNINAYSWIPYLPQAIGMAMARAAGAPPIILLYAGRLANLAVYLLVVWVALRQLPRFQLLWFCVALMPMSLHQAASLSGDSLAMAVTLLLLAFLLRLALDPRIESVNARHQIVIAGLAVVTFLCKSSVFNLPLLLLIFLIPAGKFRTRLARWQWIAVHAALAIGAAGVWNYINEPNRAALVTERAVATGIFVGENARFILQEPLAFLGALRRTLGAHSYFMIGSFVGNLGGLSTPLPPWLVWGYLVLLLAATYARKEPRLTLPQRCLIGGVALVSTLSLFVLMWCFDMRRSFLETEIPLGQGFAPVIQGRYLIPFAPLIFMAVSSSRFRLNPRWLTPAAAAAVSIASGVTLRMLWLNYYAGP